jgi:hypothetical protein
MSQIRDLGSLLKTIRTGGLRDRNKAMAVIAHHGGVSFRAIARFLHMEMRSVSEYCSTYRLFGYQRLIRGFYDRTRKADDERLQNTLFAILHTPPRTTTSTGPPGARQISRGSLRRMVIRSLVTRSGQS